MVSKFPSSGTVLWLCDHYGTLNEEEKQASAVFCFILKEVEIAIMLKRSSLISIVTEETNNWEVLPSENFETFCSLHDEIFFPLNLSFFQSVCVLASEDRNERSVK